MFEAAELGRSVKKKEFREQEPALRTALLDAQRQLQGAKHNVIVLVSGVEAAGKSAVVDRLHEWLDPRGIETHAFWDETDEERERPRFWRFWRRMPPHGQIGIMFGSWYTQPIIDHVYGNTEDAEFDRALGRIVEFERMLAASGTRLVKLWFHLSKSEQKSRVKARVSPRDGKSKTNKTDLSTIEKEFSKRYDTFAASSERAIRMTDMGEAPWHIVESTDDRYRDLTAAKILLQAIESTEEPAACKPPPKMQYEEPSADRTVLDLVDLDASLSGDEYKKQLKRYQRRLHALTWQAYKERLSLVAIFEGWDAAGKGGAIRRATHAMDARLYRVISVAAPTDEEKCQHYLWRFWRHVPRGGYTTIYDRSWYGRVLVERVEGFARSDQWSHAYREINNFESQLLDGGIALAKFWVHISKEEQLRRFKERETIAWKQHKLTDEDWRNRDKWDDYALAINDMVAHTSTTRAPWTIVPGNDKQYARIHVLRTLCECLESRLAG